VVFSFSEAARGPQGEPGESASVTNAAVNAAIEDDPEATRDSLELDEIYLPLAGGTMDDDAVITFDNGSRLKEGTTNAGANGGIAQVCSIDYELKWEAGRLFVMQQDGFTIRVEQYGFTAVPTATDDDTKGYIVGSRRILDSGVAYICTDNTTDAAVWRLDVSGNASVTLWNYRAETGSITGDPTHGKLLWDNADQISATSINKEPSSV
jgi:hypothetical protein